MSSEDYDDLGLGQNDEKLTIVPADVNLDLMTWIANEPSKFGSPNRYVRCLSCKGIIYFSKEEILGRKNSGFNTSTPCKYCSYHPAFPPPPWFLYYGHGFTLQKK